ncbi:MAG: heparinase II/III family protein [Planctomycetes bacterium]|nr:heparinase II/III family protein [Planctomycetota bacterium]
MTASSAAPVLRSDRDPSDDPFGLVPAAFPAHPRVVCTASDIARTRAWVTQHDWVRLSLKRLTEAAGQPFNIPDRLPHPADANLNNGLISYTFRNALAHLLTSEPRYLERALQGFRVLCRGYLDLTFVGHDGRATGGGLRESHFNLSLGKTYDLLAATRLTPEDDALFRAVLEESYDASNRCGHRTCGNHATWGLVGRMAVASALGDRLGVHEVLYGSPCPERSADVPDWRYGLIHQLRHDNLADGMHWERTPGYHFYTMMAMTDAAFMFSNLGIDLWHAKLPALMESDGFDLHRAYGPEGTRRLKAMYDAPFFQMFTNGDYSLLHDSGLANLRGAYIWGPVYELAYDATKDPKYAWLLNRIEREYPKDHPERKISGLPMGLQSHRGDTDFVRLRTAVIPEGGFSLAEDVDVSQTGRHRRGCTLFPTTGVTVLRNNAADERAPGAYLFWGPHSAGHQSPAALHLDLHAHGRLITSSPAHSGGGYEAANYATWIRQTIAHNTVTVDRRPMFPYDQSSGSIWEADAWRRWNSDGSTELFQTGDDFHATRAVNQAVYPGVRLDRTVVLTRDYAIDCFRVYSDATHDYEHAVHILGKADTAGHALTPIDLGDAPGYMHLKNARQLTPGHGVFSLDWANTLNGDRHTLGLQMVAPVGASFILADPPAGGDGHELGELHTNRERFTLVTRANGGRVVFITLWRFFLGRGSPVIESFAGNADRPIELTVGHMGKSHRWTLPLQNQSVHHTIA